MTLIQKSVTINAPGKHRCWRSSKTQNGKVNLTRI